MKARYPIVVVSVLVMFAAACGKQPKEIPLDAEDLAEGGMNLAYQKLIVPELKKYVANPAEVVEKINAQRYTVSSQGTTYVIYTSPDDATSWDKATVAMFDIVNRQLEGTPVRFYMLNEAACAFLTKEQYDAITRKNPRKEDWPTIPTSADLKTSATTAIDK